MGKLCLGLLLLAFLGTTAPSVRAADAPAPTSAESQLGDWRARFSPDRNVELWYRGISVVRRSSLYMVKPGWTGLLYDGRNGKPVVTVGATADGAGRVITARDQNADMRVGYTITLGADGSATTDLAYALKRDVPGDMEYAAAYLNAPLLADAPFTAQSADGPHQGVVPVATPSADEAANRFVPSFRTLALQTRVGALRVSVSGDWPDFICFDARRESQSWAQESPVFWMGLGVTSSHPLHYEGGRTFHVTTRYEFQSGAKAVPVETGVVTAGPRILTPVADARAPPSALPVVIPQPKTMALTGNRLQLDAKTRLVIADDATVQDKAAALAVRQELADRYGLSGLRIVRAAAVGALDDIVVFGEPDRVPLAARLLKAAGTKPPTRAEGYVLRVGPTWAVVAGRDPAGTFYGAQTLRQLLALDPRGPFISGAIIDDYPSLAWRGAHLFVGDHALTFHRALIENVFSRLKLNNLVLQCEQARWDRTGAAAPSWAMSKDDLRREVACAHGHFLAVTPLVASVGHMEWLFSDPARVGLAEDPQTPYAVSATNAAAYRFLFKLYDEVIDVFHPACLHIGADEVTLRGRYPYQSAATYLTVADAFSAHVTKVHDYLKHKGVKTMIWGDMLLAAGEAPDATNAPSAAQAARMRRALPKDITICDWHYAPSGDFASPHLFRQAGFNKVIGATWFNPRNIAAFSRAQAADKQFGLLQTTWAGFDSSAQNLVADPQQFAAFVLAADAAWTGGQIGPNQMSYNPASIFAAWYAPSRLDARIHTGFVVDLAAVANRRLSDDAGRGGWLGYGPGRDLRGVPVGAVRLGDTRYVLSPKATMLYGALNPVGIAYPQRVAIPLGRKAASVSLVLATAFAALPQTPVGTVTVTYADGATATLPLVYGQNIAAWDDARDVSGAPVVWHGTAVGANTFLRALIWTNPNLDKVIRAVTLATDDPSAAPTLFAITGLDN